MRISDWSSDVCSSDLAFVACFAQLLAGRNEALGARLLAAFDAARGDMRLFGEAGAAIIAARLGISGARRGDQAGEGERRGGDDGKGGRSEEHTSELQSLMRISYAVFCLKKKKTQQTHKNKQQHKNK